MGIITLGKSVSSYNYYFVRITELSFHWFTMNFMAKLLTNYWMEKEWKIQYMKILFLSSCLYLIKALAGYQKLCLFFSLNLWVKHRPLDEYYTWWFASMIKRDLEWLLFFVILLSVMKLIIFRMQFSCSYNVKLCCSPHS